MEDDIYTPFIAALDQNEYQGLLDDIPVIRKISLDAPRMLEYMDQLQGQIVFYNQQDLDQGMDLDKPDPRNENWSKPSTTPIPEFTLREDNRQLAESLLLQDICDEIFFNLLEETPLGNLYAALMHDDFDKDEPKDLFTPFPNSMILSHEDVGHIRILTQMCMADATYRMELVLEHEGFLADKVTVLFIHREEWKL